jgi:hypothetical protein
MPNSGKPEFGAGEGAEQSEADEGLWYSAPIFACAAKICSMN